MLSTRCSTAGSNSAVSRDVTDASHGHHGSLGGDDFAGGDRDTEPRSIERQRGRQQRATPTT